MIMLNQNDAELTTIYARALGTVKVVWVLHSVKDCANGVYWVPLRSMARHGKTSRFSRKSATSLH